MLTTLLDSIRSQFGSKSYWLGSMLPLILFLAANAAMAYPHVPSIAAPLFEAQSWDTKTFKYSVFLLILLTLAYLLSTISSVLLRMLEGKIGPVAWFAGLLRPSQTRARQKLDHDYRMARGRDRIAEARKRWIATLESATSAGQEQPAQTKAEQDAWPKSETGKCVAGIRESQERGEYLSFEKLDRAVALLALDLATHQTRPGSLLMEAYHRLRDAIQYGMDRRKFDLLRLLKQRQTNFPGVRPTAKDQPEGGVANDILAPTAMGNIGRTIGTYSLVRYQMDLDIFWTRLQNAIQKEKDYYSVVQDSKVQVDTMVMLFWMSVLFTLFWPAALVFVFGDSTVFQFLIAGILGPACAMAFYSLACESYRVFADLMRSSVDLFRFEVLKSLHLAVPADSEDEKALWLRLANATGFLDPVGFQYK